MRTHTHHKKKEGVYSCSFIYFWIIYDNDDEEAKSIGRSCCCCCCLAMKSTGYTLVIDTHGMVNEIGCHGITTAVTNRVDDREYINPRRRCGASDFGQLLGPSKHELQVLILLQFYFKKDHDEYRQDPHFDRCLSSGSKCSQLSVQQTIWGESSSCKMTIDLILFL